MERVSSMATKQFAKNQHERTAFHQERRNAVQNCRNGLQGNNCNPQDTRAFIHVAKMRLPQDGVDPNSFPHQPKKLIISVVDIHILVEYISTGK